MENNTKKDLLRFERDYNFGSAEYEAADGTLDHNMIKICGLLNQEKAPKKPVMS